MNIHYLKPEFLIGKRGINDQIVRDIKSRLKKKKILKIKFLPAAIKGTKKQEVFEKLAKEANAKIIKKIGFTLVLKYEGS